MAELSSAAGRVGTVLLGALLLLGACHRGPPGGEQEASPAALDTAGAVSGVPRDRLEEYARPMTPEEAEQEGIVDTSIYLEDASPPPAEGTPIDSVRGDTMRPPAP